MTDRTAQTNAARAKAQAALALLEEQYSYYTADTPVAPRDTSRTDEILGAVAYHQAA